jgi:hypothetical protein
MICIAGILVCDAIAVLASYHCFAEMNHGRKTLLGESEPEMPRSILYAALSDWRR